MRVASGPSRTLPLFLACTLLLFAGHAFAQTGTPGASGKAPAIDAKGAAVKPAGEPWDEAAGLQVLADDAVDAKARIFDSPDYQTQLIVPGTGESAFVLGLKTQTLRLLPGKSIFWTAEDKPVPNLADAVSSGPFMKQGDVVSFTANDASWQVQPEPPLVGPVSLEKLEEAKPDYVYAASRYTPDAASVQALRKLGTDTQVVIFFGTWCTYCKHWLPRFLKTLETVNNPKLTAEFYGMSEDQVEPRDAISKYRVTATPTFIVLQGGKEVGRVQEEPQESMEADLARILKLR